MVYLTNNFSNQELRTVTTIPPLTAVTQPKLHFAPKWDWPLAFALFIGGMSVDDLLKLEQFQGMNKHMLQNRISKDNWIAKRKETQQELGTSMARSLSERLIEAGEVHQEFMRHRLERERKVLDGVMITSNMDDQNLRLKNLGMIDEMARKLTGLDDRKPLDPQRLNLSITVALASGHQPAKKASAAGISASRNAILVNVQTAPKHVKGVPEGTLNTAVSILRAKEDGTLKEFAKSQATLDLEVEEIDRENLKPLAPIKIEEVLVNENHGTDCSDETSEEPEEDLVDTLRNAGYDARDMTDDEVLQAIENQDTKNPDASEDTPGLDEDRD